MGESAEGGGQGRASQTKGSCFCHMPHPSVPAPLARCLDQTEAHMLVYVPSSRVLPPDNRRVCVYIHLYVCVCVVNNSQSFLPSAALSLCQTMPGMVRNVFEPSSPRVGQEFHQPKTAMVQPKGVARGGRQSEGCSAAFGAFWSPSKRIQQCTLVAIAFTEL